MRASTATENQPYDLMATTRQFRGQGSSGGAIPQPVIFPPEIYPIPGATILANGTVTGVSVSNAGGPQVLATLNFPAQARGVIRHVSWGLTGMATSTNISWIIQFNSSPYTYGPLVISPPRAAVFAGDDRDVVIRIPDGTGVATLVASVAASDGGTYTVGGSLEGWWWMPQQEEAYREGRLGS